LLFIFYIPNLLSRVQILYIFDENMAKIFWSEGRGPGRREKRTDMGYEK
jgi:hypothetical protein